MAFPVQGESYCQHLSVVPWPSNRTTEAHHDEWVPVRVNERNINNPSVLSESYLFPVWSIASVWFCPGIVDLLKSAAQQIRVKVEVHSLGEEEQVQVSDVELEQVQGARQEEGQVQVCDVEREQGAHQEDEKYKVSLEVGGGGEEAGRRQEVSLCGHLDLAGKACRLGAW